VAASKIDICNTALLYLGQQAITSVNDTSERAIVITKIYDSTRRQLLMGHPWNFSTKRAELTKVTDPPVFGYTYKYAVPSDCLRILRINGSEYDTYVVQDGYILTNSEECKVVYVFDQINSGKFSSQFDEALALSMSTKASYKFNQSTSQIQLFQSMFQEAISLARSFDGQEGTSPGLNPNEFLLARSGLANNSTDISGNFEDGEI